MDNIFSDSKLIDYIILADLDITTFNQNKRKEKMFGFIDDPLHTQLKFKYKVINYFPKTSQEDASSFEQYFQVTYK